MRGKMLKQNKISSGLLFVFAALSLLIGGTSNSGQGPLISAVEAVPNEILIKFNPAIGAALVRQELGSLQASIINYHGGEIAAGAWTGSNENERSFLGDPNLFHVRVPESIGVERALSLIRSRPWVEYAEMNFKVHLDVIPADTYFSSLWGLNNGGAQGGTIDADIDGPEAWEINTGSSVVIVAILDTGIDYTHVDLDANIWMNSSESDAYKADGIDNDGNGYIDDWVGWDFNRGYAPPYHEDNDPMDDYDDPTVPGGSENYHGTHVAGIVGAEGNNGTGVTGVCWNVKLMALKICDWRGLSEAADAIHAIDYAIAAGANIINASWHLPYSDALLSAINRARTSGIIFVAAAGNSYKNTDIYPQYPSCYDLDNIISVLSTDYNDQLSPLFSNYGPYSVDLGAPGGTDPYEESYNIFSTKRGNDYQYHAGTSMAAPYVSGMAALLWSQRPGLSWWENKTILLKSVDSLGSLLGKAQSHGRLNAYKALTYQTPVLPAAPSDLDAQVYPAEFGYDIELTWLDNSNNESGFIIYRKSGNVFWEIDRTAPNETSYWDRELPAGYWYYYVRSYRQDGESTKTLVAAAKAFGSSSSH